MTRTREMRYTENRGKGATDYGKETQGTGETEVGPKTRKEGTMDTATYVEMLRSVLRAISYAMGLAEQAMEALGEAYQGVEEVLVELERREEE